MDNLLSGAYAKIRNFKVKDVQKHVFEELEDENYHLLNNFLALYGLFGDSIRLDYVKLYNEYPQRILKPFNKAYEETREKTRDDIVKAIKGLKFLADNGNEKAKKAIKGLEILFTNTSSIKNA
jgi:uncharacterized protein (UPF0297 family)